MVPEILVKTVPVVFSPDFRELLKVPVLVSNFESKKNTSHFCSRKQKRELENERRKKTERNRKRSIDGKSERERERKKSKEEKRERGRRKERKLRDQNDVYRQIEIKKGRKKQK